MTEKAGPGARVRSAWKTWAVELALGFALFFGIRAYQTRTVARGHAPVLNASALDGSSVTLDGPVVVHFWATWCGVCQAEESNIVALAKSHRVIAIASESGDTVRAYVQAHGLPMTVIDDRDGRISKAWGVQAFPTSFYLDKSGDIRFAEVGYTTRLGMLARTWWIGG